MGAVGAAAPTIFSQWLQTMSTDRQDAGTALELGANVYADPRYAGSKVNPTQI